MTDSTVTDRHAPNHVHARKHARQQDLKGNGATATYTDVRDGSENGNGNGIGNRNTASQLPAFVFEETEGTEAAQLRGEETLDFGG